LFVLLHIERPSVQRVRPPFFYGWVVVAVATFAMFASTLTGGAGFSVFIAPMAADLGWSRSVLTGALSLGTITGALLAPYVGRLIDRYGARVSLTLCGLGIAVALSAISGVHTEIVFIVAYATARAIDMGALNVSVTTAVSNWFVRRRGRALGIAVAGNAIGVMLLVPIIQVVIDGPGWRPAWLVIGGGSGLILAASSALLLRRRPEDLGLRPDGATPSDLRTDRSRLAAATQLLERPWTARRALGSSAFWLLILASCGSQIAATGMVTNQAPMLIEQGLSSPAVAGAIGIYGFAWTVGTLAWGLVVERLSARFSLAIGSLLIAGCCFGLLFVHDVSTLVAFAIAFGVATGAKEALDAIVWADYFGREAVGAIRGISRPFIVGAGALGAFLGGLGYDLTGSYTAITLVFGVLALFGVGASFLARPPTEQVTAAA
jgi:MFS family permease